MRRPAWAELVRSGLAQARAGSHRFEWFLNWTSAGLGCLNWISMNSGGMNRASTGLASLDQASAAGTCAFASSAALFLVACCSASVACPLLLATCRLLCATFRVPLCCLRAHSMSLPHCTFPAASFFASSTKSCPDFDFSGRELRL